MQTRRNFFKKLAGIVAGAIISPQVVKALENTSENINYVDSNNANLNSKLYSELLSDDENDKKLTERFFSFLNNNHTNFKWQRIYKPMFQINNDKPYMCVTHLMKGSNSYWVKNINEEKIFTEFCKSIGDCKLYIYKLNYTTHIYNPRTFEATRKIVIRYTKR